MKWLLTRILITVTLFNLNFYPIVNLYSSSSAITLSRLLQLVDGLSVTEAFACAMDECMTVTPPRRNEISFEHDEASYRGGSGGSYGKGGSGSSSEASANEALEDYEIVADGLTTLVQVKNELNKLLARIGSDLTPQAKQLIRNEIAKLDSAISKGNLLLGAINSGSQTSIHLAKSEYLLAAGEIIALVAGVVAGATFSGPVATVIASIGTAYVVEEAFERLVIPWIQETYNLRTLFVPSGPTLDPRRWHCNMQVVRSELCQEIR